MNKIIKKEQWSEKVFMFWIEAPLIAAKRKPGNFVIIRLYEGGERVPLTIADADEEKGTIMLVVQAIGKSTMLLCQMNEGDSILDVVGPLGRPTDIHKEDGIVLCVCGGIGVAPMHPIAEAHHKAGNKVISILGARSKELISMEEDMKKISDEVVICTDDGSYGEKGLVTDMIKGVHARGEKISEVIAIGPAIMMKFVCICTKELGLRTTVSLNPIMIDGTGMCGGCRVLVGTETKFACVDGPEFDGHLIDFDLLMQRQATYRDHECKVAEAVKTVAK